MAISLQGEKVQNGNGLTIGLTSSGIYRSLCWGTADLTGKQRDEIISKVKLADGEKLVRIVAGRKREAHITVRDASGSEITYMLFKNGEHYEPHRDIIVKMEIYP